MTITLTYQPDKSVSFGDTLLLWDTDRQQVRKLLNGNFETADSIIDLSQYNNGDTSKNIIQRRDIYKKYREQDNFFFLNFDTSDRLTAVEVHNGLCIKIENVVIDFSMNIEKATNLLESISSDTRVQLADEDYLFKNLKLTIASRNAMGGDGTELSYLFCSKDITHLLDGNVCS